MHTHTSHTPQAVGYFPDINHVSNSDCAFPSLKGNIRACDALDGEIQLSIHYVSESSCVLKLPAGTPSLQDLGICKPQNLVKPHIAHALLSNMLCFLMTPRGRQIDLANME